MPASNYPGGGYPGEYAPPTGAAPDVSGTIECHAAAAGCQILGTFGASQRVVVGGIGGSLRPGAIGPRRRPTRPPLVVVPAPAPVVLVPVRGRIAVRAAAAGCQIVGVVVPPPVDAAIASRAAAAGMRMWGEVDLTVIEDDELLLAGVF